MTPTTIGRDDASAGLPNGPGGSEGPAATQRAATASTEGKSRRILIVDDNLDSAETFMSLLQMDDAHHEVRIASDGETAVKCACTFKPEVVFLDIGLPGMDGYETARQLKRIQGLEDLMLIAMTGYGQDDDRRQSREAGFDQHWVKPIDLDAVDEVLRRLP